MVTRQRIIITVAVLAYTVMATASRAADPPSAIQWATGFSPPAGLAFSTDGTAFACNYRRSGTIGRILTDGSSAIWCDLDEISPAQNKSMPAAIVIDSEGRLVVADSANGRLLRIDKEKRVTVLAARFEGLAFEQVVATTLRGPGGDAPGTEIVFAATLKKTGEEAKTFLFIYDLKTSTLRKLEIEPSLPISMTTTPDGKWLVVVESPQNRIWKHSLEKVAGDREAFERLGELGGDANALKLPKGLCASNQTGSIFVAAGHRKEISEIHLESGQTLRTFSLPGEHGVACAIRGQELFVVIQEKEAIFRVPLMPIAK
jgi:sugar lactone lactonase YvrE